MSLIKNVDTNARANLLFINNTSSNIIQGRSPAEFGFDIGALNINLNQQHKLFLKSVCYQNSVYQVNSIPYNYGLITLVFYRRLNINTTQSIRMSISDGCYTITEFISAIQTSFNNACTTLGITDKYTLTYQGFNNTILFTRNTLTNLGGGDYWDCYFTTQDTYSQYNGNYGYGLGFLMGFNENSKFYLPQSTGVNSGIVSPSQVQLQPFQYGHLCIEGLSNVNLSSDIGSLSSISLLPFVVSDRWGNTFIDEPNPDLCKSYFSILPRILWIRILDQYGNLIVVPNSWECTIFLRLESFE